MPRHPYLQIPATYTFEPRSSDPEWLTLDKAASMTPQNKILVCTDVTENWRYPLDGRTLRRKVKITPEGIALPNGQLLYRFADQEPRGEPK